MRIKYLNCINSIQFKTTALAIWCFFSVPLKFIKRICAPLCTDVSDTIQCQSATTALYSAHMHGLRMIRPREKTQQEKRM